jgi:hypothetical protein
MSGMAHKEEREFVLRFELVCEFPDDYEGEEDGYAWADELPQLAAELVRSAVHVIGQRPGWKVRPKNRGRSSLDEVTLLVEKTPSG